MSSEQNPDTPVEVSTTIESSDFLLKHQCGIDLSDRYEDILQRQFDSLENLENKAWKTIGAITSVIGILLAGFSLLVRFGSQPIDVGLIDVLPLVIGIFCLFISIVYCIFVLVSAEAAYGPATSLGEKLTAGDIDQEYVDFVLKNYRNSITRNWTRISTKSDHLRKSFVFLITGLLFSTVAFLFMIFISLNTTIKQKLVILVLVILISFIIGRYIWDREFQVDPDTDKGSIDQDD